jgi:hypothetical protein
MVFRITQEDIDRYRGQAKAILRKLNEFPGQWVSVGALEVCSGTTRAAARIHTLRKDWEIEMRRDPYRKRGQYRLTGTAKPKLKKAHCETCTCSRWAVLNDGEMQSEMQF